VPVADDRRVADRKSRPPPLVDLVEQKTDGLAKHAVPMTQVIPAVEDARGSSSSTNLRRWRRRHARVVPALIARDDGEVRGEEETIFPLPSSPNCATRRNVSSALTTDVF